MRHTPGPWRLAESAMEQWVAGTTEEGAPSDIVCDRPHFATNQERWEANARLIAAAPELAGAAKDALESLRRLPDMDGAYRVTVIQELEKALSKAGVL